MGLCLLESCPARLITSGLERLQILNALGRCQPASLPSWKAFYPFHSSMEEPSISGGNIWIDGGNSRTTFERPHRGARGGVQVRESLTGQFKAAHPSDAASHRPLMLGAHGPPELKLLLWWVVGTHLQFLGRHMSRNLFFHLQAPGRLKQMASEWMALVAPGERPLQGPGDISQWLSVGPSELLWSALLPFPPPPSSLIGTVSGRPTLLLKRTKKGKSGGRSALVHQGCFRCSVLQCWSCWMQQALVWMRPVPSTRVFLPQTASRVNWICNAVVVSSLGFYLISVVVTTKPMGHMEPRKLFTWPLGPPSTTGRPQLGRHKPGGSANWGPGETC